MWSIDMFHGEIFNLFWEDVETILWETKIVGGFQALRSCMIKSKDKVYFLLV